ncbi:MAG: tetratricopeptide repeat protein [Verrucomicrobiia bacterium]
MLRSGALLILVVCIGLFAGCGPGSFAGKDPESLIRTGAELLASFAFAEAEPRLRVAREEVEPGSELWQKATFLLAVSLRHQTPPSPRKIEEARLLLETLLQEAPESRYAPDALIALARLDELRNFPGDPVNPEGAARRYREVLERFPDSDLADLAFLRLAAQGTLDAGNLEAARQTVALLEARMAERPDSPYRWAYWELLASINRLLLKDRPAALRAMIEADRSSLNAEGRRGTLFWNIATLAEELGDRKTAELYYKRLWEKAPRSLRNTEAKARYEALRAERGGEG